MWLYWLMFFIPALGTIAPRRLPANQARVLWWLIGMLFALMIGFRYEVGGDWFNYLTHFHNSAKMSLADVVTAKDPGHYALNHLVAKLGGNIYTVNLFYAALLMLGTMIFCRSQPNPWLSLLVSVPYLLIVVGMGYTRQSAALGLAMIGLVALGNRHLRTFIICISLGALFHKSAVLLLPVAALASSRNRWISAAIVAATTGLLYYLLLADNTETLWTNYVEADLHSSGGMIRIAINAIPAILFIAFRRQLTPDPEERKLWLLIAISALICVPLVGFASTAVDRVALYMIPLQLYVFARLPRLTPSMISRTALVVGIITYYSAIQFVWLNFATHALYWVPYRLMPLA